MVHPAIKILLLGAMSLLIVASFYVSGHVLTYVLFIATAFIVETNLHRLSRKAKDALFHEQDILTYLQNTAKTFEQSWLVFVYAFMLATLMLFIRWPLVQKIVFVIHSIMLIFGALLYSAGAWKLFFFSTKKQQPHQHNEHKEEQIKEKVQQK